MADPNVQTKARKQAKPRAVGPRTVFMIFREGTDSAFVQQVEASIEKLTMNGRVLLDNLKGGKQRPFITSIVEVTPKGERSDG